MVYAFDAPVGTVEERRSDQIWPGHWFDATGYAVAYPPEMHRSDYHTGADLNLNFPFWNADAHAPCYAAADGIVKVAAQFPVWGAIIVIEHAAVPEVGRVFTRYAHLERFLVGAGDRIQRGVQIGAIGNANGRYAYHLHFDIARADLAVNPTDWPNADLRRLLATYIDPAKFIREHRGVELMAADGARLDRVRVTAQPRLRVRQAPNPSGAIIGYVPHGQVLTLRGVQNGWGSIDQPAGWIDLQWTEPA